MYDTPKHASWMKQVEIWLRILVRKLLKRGNFTTLDDLRDQILAFIAYSNLFQLHDGETHQVDVYGAYLIVELFTPQCTSLLAIELVSITNAAMMQPVYIPTSAPRRAADHILCLDTMNLCSSRFLRVNSEIRIKHIPTSNVRAYSETMW